MEFTIRTFAQLKSACIALQNQYPPKQVFALHGNLGSGKTTFVKTFLHQISSSIEVNSPTYSIVNEYEYERKEYFHFDLYRLNDELELLHIGFEDYFDRGQYHFIEWPELAEPYLPEGTIHLYLKNSNFERTLTVKNE